MSKVFIFFWCLAGLLTLDVVLRTPRHVMRATRPAATNSTALAAIPPDSLPLIRALQTRCELPAGTIVFVVRERVP